jgi:UDPglucose 6-dehydrogenase
MKILIAGNGFKCLSNIILLQRLKKLSFFYSKVVNDLAEFKQKTFVMLANRLTKDIIDEADKIYSCIYFVRTKLK